MIFCEGKVLRALWRRNPLIFQRSFFSGRRDHYQILHILPRSNGAARAYAELQKQIRSEFARNL